VDYALTPLGRSLQTEVSQLKRWAEVHMHAILEARRRYDASEPKQVTNMAAS
jgi:DNA-binding HxlR family transcriptional regulator